MTDASSRPASDSVAGTALAVVEAWLAAANAGDVATVASLSHPDLVVGGPRGSSRGLAVLERWLADAGARFTTVRRFAAGPRVVLAQRGTWGAPDGRTSEADVATQFDVDRGKVALVIRHATLADALAAAGLSEEDAA
jgi:hypothetical protein